jgi:hypothetical protein
VTVEESIRIPQLTFCKVLELRIFGARFLDLVSKGIPFVDEEERQEATALLMNVTGEIKCWG